METRFRWAVVLAMILVALAASFVAYNAGVSHGLATVAPGAAPAAGAEAPYVWHRPWGFWFFGPFVCVLFWFLVLRLVFWGAFHGRRWCYPGRYDAGSWFEDWHRRAHERMSGQPPTQT